LHRSIIADFGRRAISDADFPLAAAPALG